MTSTKLRDIKNDHLKPSTSAASHTSIPTQSASSAVVHSAPVNTENTTQADFLSNIKPSDSSFIVKKPSKKDGIIIGLVVFCVFLGGGGFLLLNENKNIRNDSAQMAAEEAQRAASEAIVAAEHAQQIEHAQEDALPPEDSEELAEGENEGVVDAPLLTQGSSWNYRVIDYVNPKNSFDNVSLSINNVTSDGYIFEKQWVGSNRDIAYLDYDDNLNPRAGATGSYEPALGYYNFPLEPGKTWHTESKVLNHKYSTRDQMTFSGKVVGWEKVSSPSWQNVNALRIEVEILSYKDGVEVSKELDVSWYEPEVGRAIKTLEYKWDEGTESFGRPIREQYVFNYNRR